MEDERLAAILRGDPLGAAELNALHNETEDIVATEMLRRRWGEDHRQESLRIWKAMMLAKTVEDCDDLLLGKHVPLERLDPFWVKRFGLES